MTGRTVPGEPGVPDVLRAASRELSRSAEDVGAAEEAVGRLFGQDPAPAGADDPALQSLDRARQTASGLSSFLERLADALEGEGEPDIAAVLCTVAPAHLAAVLAGRTPGSEDDIFF